MVNWELSRIGSRYRYAFASPSLAALDLLISRTCQAFATLHSRLTLADEMPITSAVPSSDSPPLPDAAFAPPGHDSDDLDHPTVEKFAALRSDDCRPALGTEIEPSFRLGTT